MRYLLLGVLTCVPVLAGMGEAVAHGSNIEYRQTEAIQITAKYDSGTPMGEAQVTVYSPDDPATPWVQGVTDEQGNFTFVPDPDQRGNWEVKVRQSGHGDIISIPLEEQEAETASTSESATITQATTNTTGYSPLQKGVMAVVGVWGCVGTALFFLRKKGE
ncbi:carboxypeptidase regulatory-like domain-containing protein [Spirulina sp. CS-785/01]|uniref:carboxypeptidase regulatory-like domain-containing protein n=1 Tax=Spirulina sp. CS-785/01 TaxID=3021716 RepID=UPI00232E3945|nr:carboxypeptidase regulatory-like domain-containing protein [Spirulina sp. CS-785/01]MDB9314154.1 carboxypeptidase regulatory-like domain-containing protein [Spirulina sp. CS-785/01]